MLAQKAYILFYIQREAPSAKLPAFLTPATAVANSTAARGLGAAPLTAAPRGSGGPSAAPPPAVSAPRAAAANGTTAPGALAGRAGQPKQQPQAGAADAQLRGSCTAAMSGQPLSPAQPGEGKPVLQHCLAPVPQALRNEPALYSTLSLPSAKEAACLAPVPSLLLSNEELAVFCHDFLGTSPGFRVQGIYLNFIIQIKPRSSHTPDLAPLGAQSVTPMAVAPPKLTRIQTTTLPLPPRRHAFCEKREAPVWLTACISGAATTLTSVLGYSFGFYTAEAVLPQRIVW